MNIKDIVSKSLNYLDKYYIRGLGRKLTLDNGNTVRAFYSLPPYESVQDYSTYTDEAHVEVNAFDYKQAGGEGVGDILTADDFTHWEVKRGYVKDELDRIIFVIVRIPLDTNKVV